MHDISYANLVMLMKTIPDMPVYKKDGEGKPSDLVEEVKGGDLKSLFSM